jgi:hypothetical protein
MKPNSPKDRAMHKGDNPSFWSAFIRSNVFLIVQFIFIISSKYQNTKLLGCRDPLGITVHQQGSRPRGSMYNWYDAIFYAPDAHFDNWYLFGDAQVWHKNNVHTCNERERERERERDLPWCLFIQMALTIVSIQRWSVFLNHSIF